MNTLQTVLSFAVTGAVLSGLAEYTKSFLVKSGHRVLYVLGISIVGGLGVYFFHLVPTNWVETILGVWASVNTAYLAITQWLPSSTTPPAA